MKPREYVFRVAGPCVIADCDCRRYDGASVAEWVARALPLHAGCTCVVIRAGQEDPHSTGALGS